jgi:hypothetical protein
MCEILPLSDCNIGLPRVYLSRLIHESVGGKYEEMIEL